MTPGGPAAAPEDAPRPTVDQGAPIEDAPGVMPGDAPEDAPEGGEPATPEEEALNEEFITQAQLVIYDSKFFPKILDLLDDPKAKEAIAKTAAMVVKRVYDTGKSAGREFSGDVILNAAKEIYEDLADTASQFRYIDFTADPDAFEGGYYLMMDNLRVMAQEAGDLDMDAVQADFAAMNAQDGAAPVAPGGVPANVNAPPAANVNAPPAAGAPRAGRI